jgi:hypothetical protein
MDTIIGILILLVIVVWNYIMYQKFHKVQNVFVMGWSMAFIVAMLINKLTKFFNDI